MLFAFLMGRMKLVDILLFVYVISGKSSIFASLFSVIAKHCIDGRDGANYRT